MTKLNAIYRTDFQSFMRKAFRISNPGQKLGDDPYLAYLSYVAEQIADGKNRRQVVNLPPAHLKTFLFSIAMVAWIIARDPTKRIMVVTNAQSLAEQITYSIRQIIRSSWFKELSDTKLAEDWASAADFKTTGGGRVFATSADAKFTGERADIIVVDDLLDIAEARNDARVQELNNKFDTKIETRLNDPRTGVIVIVAHRLHDDDLSAHVMSEGGWDRVALEMVAERERSYPTEGGTFVRGKGDLLRQGLFTKKKIKRLRETAAIPEFRLLYQQGRGVKSASKITRKDFALFEAKTVRSLPVVVSVDTAQKGAGASRHAIQVWKTDGRNHYLIEARTLSCNYGDLRIVLAGLGRKFPPSKMLIEDASSGSMLIAELQAEGAANVLPVVPRKSKAERLAVHLGTIKKQRIHLLRGAEWLGDWVSEVVAFPEGANDQVDALTQFLAFMAMKPELTPPPASEKKERAVLVRGSQMGRPAEMRGCVVVRSPSIFRPNWQRDWI